MKQNFISSKSNTTALHLYRPFTLSVVLTGNLLLFPMTAYGTLENNVIKNSLNSLYQQHSLYQQRTSPSFTKSVAGISSLFLLATGFHLLYSNPASAENDKSSQPPPKKNKIREKRFHSPQKSVFDFTPLETAFQDNPIDGEGSTKPSSILYPSCLSPTSAELATSNRSAIFDAKSDPYLTSNPVNISSNELSDINAWEVEGNLSNSLSETESLLINNNQQNLALSMMAVPDELGAEFGHDTNQGIMTVRRKLAADQFSQFHQQFNFLSSTYQSLGNLKDEINDAGTTVMSGTNTLLWYNLEKDLDTLLRHTEAVICSSSDLI